MHDDTAAQAELDAVPAPGVTESYSGPATVETYTVVAGRSGERTGIVVGRLPDGTRTLATTARGDDAAADFLMSEHPFGAAFDVIAGEKRNTAAGFRA